VDRFGDEWLLSLPEIEAREPAPAGTLTWQQRQVVEDLVFFSFQHSGAVDDEVARVLLRVYDELANESLSAELDHPTDDPRGLLIGLDQEMRPLLTCALADDRLRIEKVVRPPWPFHDEPNKPASIRADPSVSEEAPPPAPVPPPADASEFDDEMLAAQVAVLRAAAATGAPFCEECAKAAQAARVSGAGAPPP
jgi:hypothetical protein